MALVSHMSLTGASQGPIAGDSTSPGYEGQIRVYEMDYEVEIPTDPQKGTPTGQRIHKAFKIVKHVDRSSPQLFQACCTGETITEWELSFVQISDKGTEEEYYSVKLKNAIIVMARLYKPNIILPENKPFRDMEEIHFTFSDIIWSHKVAGVESQDSFK